MAAIRRLPILECLVFVIGHPSNDLQGPCTFFHYTALTDHREASVAKAAVFDGLRFFLRFAISNPRANWQSLTRSGAWGGAQEKM
jgi:hypothetical protein